MSLYRVSVLARWWLVVPRRSHRLMTRHIGTKKSDVELGGRFRNIGLVAHIDAGKTTTTERMLYYSGLTSQMGEVHHGDTVMDWMHQERERGITISSAAATIDWLGHRINLIDTPGHVDFTFEVERSLSVLDSAVVILDSSAGVQAQTIKVWQQANRYQLPRLIYLNKMDKPNASLSLCLESIQKKLSAQPLLLHEPLYQENRLIGLLDLISGVCYHWPADLSTTEQGKLFLAQPLLSPSDDLEPFLKSNEEQRYKEMLSEGRETLIGQLSDLDSDLAQLMLSTDHLDQVPTKEIQRSLRKVCIEQLAFPVLCGSSYRKVGVQPLLDSIVHYLPCPLETERSRQLYESYCEQTHPLCALAFKITYDRRLGPLTYLRIYSGELQPGQMVYNLSRQVNEKITRIYRPFADHFADISSEIRFEKGVQSTEAPVVRLGDIVAVSGLNQAITGDTLVHMEQNNPTDLLMAGIEVPDPVFYCSLESPSISKLKQLEIALEQLQREDPSLKVTHDKQSNQMVIKGMGELHIEIIKDRIQREYRIDVSTGRLQVSYQESILEPQKVCLDQNRTIGGVANQVSIELEIRPSARSKTSEIRRLKDLQIKVVNTKENNLASQLRPWHLKAIQTGVFKALEHGPLFSFPVVDVDVLLHGFSTTRRTTLPFITHTATECVLQALRQSNPVLLEPIMRLEIVTPEQYLGPVTSDLSMRRAEFGQPDTLVAQQQQPDIRHLLAYVPLAELTNYSSVLRRISSGMASFDLYLHSYRTMDQQQTDRAIRAISGVD